MFCVVGWVVATKDYGFGGSFNPKTRRWEAFRDNEIEDETIEEIDSVEAKEVISKTHFKSVQEVKSMDAIKSMQEIKNLYELTEKQVKQLKDEMAFREMAARQWRV